VCFAFATCENVRRRPFPLPLAAIGDGADPRLRADPMSNRAAGEGCWGESDFVARARGEGESTVRSLNLRPPFLRGTGMPAGSPSPWAAASRTVPVPLLVGSAVCPPSLVAVSRLLPMSWRTLLVLKRLDHDPREDMDEKDIEARFPGGEDAECIQVGDD
jgi:hypothetical protein